jgi:hypothetical protein
MMWGCRVTARSRLYLARNQSVTVVARKRPWLPGSRIVRRRWYATLVERVSAAPAPQSAWSLVDAATTLLPPLLVFLLTAFVTASVPLAFGAGCGVFFLMAYLGPARHWVVADRLLRGRSANARVLSQSAGREIFDRALASADRISESWPELGALVRVTDAEAMLTEALWELAGVLVKAEKLHTVLVELSRPDFTQRSFSDETAMEVEDHRRATQRALVALNEEITRRVAGIERAEAAGDSFVREKSMRRAIHAAEESLRGVREEDAMAAGVPRPDAGTELAEHTQSVLEAYQELTARFRIGGS